MSRYTNDITTEKPPETLDTALREYLGQQGFKLIDASNNVWQKGMGLLTGPQFVSFAAQPGKLHLEAWIKWALFPGVYLGEMGIDGALGLIPKRMLKARVVEIEKLA